MGGYLDLGAKGGRENLSVGRRILDEGLPVLRHFVTSEADFWQVSGDALLRT